MGSTKLINEKFICPGDKLETLITKVSNNSLHTVTGILINVTIPYGLKYSSSNLSQGIYNPISRTWEIGTLRSSRTASGSFLWEVTDDCYTPYKVEFKSGSSNPQVCIGDLTEACFIIDGLTKCQLDTYKNIKTVAMDYAPTLHDYSILIDASNAPIEITLPEPSTVYRNVPENPIKNGGTEYHFKVIDLTNSITLKTPSGKIVNFSTVGDATDTYTFSLVGQATFVHTDGTNYYVKSL